MTFDIIAERPLENVAGTGTVLRHCETGAELLAVRNTDPEMVFGVLLETLPETSDGVAHLLEHLIFRGSERFPETHLYSKLMQGSRLTGLNASTKADSTLFHLSSADRGDFKSLIDVMMDAVFHPLLRERDFSQERAVVLNEMVGHHALPDNRILERLRQELLPGTVYTKDHGGDPQLINALKYEELRLFHSKHYRPAKARLFLWGDFDLAKRLDQLDRLLAFKTKPKEPAVKTPTWVDTPKYLTEKYAAFEAGPLLTGFGWAFPKENCDLWQAMSLGMLAENSGPIVQAFLRHSGQVIGLGYRSDTPLGTFEIALAGHSEGAAANLKDTLGQAITDVQKDPHLEEWLRSAAIRFEFELRSFGSRSHGPDGLRALNMIRGQWRHGADPLGLLDIDARAARLHEIITTDPQTIVRHLKEDLLENPHSVILSMSPEYAKYPPAAQQPFPMKAPDPTKAVGSSALPFISAGRDRPPLHSIAIETEGNVLYLPNLGPDLARAELAVALSGLSMAQMDLMCVFEILLADQITAEGIDISVRPWAVHCVGKPDAAWLSISGRSLPALAAPMLDHICECLWFALPPVEVIGHRISAARAAIHTQLAALGHMFCEVRLRANGSIAGTLNEHLVGIHRLLAYDQALEIPPEQLVEDLETLRDHLVAHAQMTLAVASLPSSLVQISLPDRPALMSVTRPLSVASFESITTGSANFTTGQAVHLTEVGPAHVAAHMLETGWLWDSVRVASGAYSVRCGYNGDDGLMTLLSIRDPSPERTLEYIAQAPRWLQTAAESDLLSCCVAAKAGHLARPVRPDLMLATALQRHLSGRTDALRQIELERVQCVDTPAMKDFVQHFEAVLPKAKTVILGPRSGNAALA
jgi:Zn-dependent M16 (insulinase) family peptidase